MYHPKNTAVLGSTEILTPYYVYQQANYSFILSYRFGSYTTNYRPASVAQLANTLTEPQCNGPGKAGWLARRRGFNFCCCRCSIKYLSAK